MSDVKPLTEQEEREGRMAFATCTMAPIGPDGSLVVYDFEQVAVEWTCYHMPRLFATLDALRARLAEVERERDRYKAEAMAARAAIYIGDAIDPLTLSGVGIEWPQVAEYRAIRAANEKAEGA